MAEVTKECIDRRRGLQKESWIKERTWKIIDKRKSVKYRMQQAKTLPEKEETKNEYSDLNRQVRKSCRADQNKWLEKKGEEAVEAASKNDAKTVYRITKDLTGKKTSSSVPITDKNKKVLATAEEQETQWVEHFEETLNQPDPETTYNFDNEIHLPKLNVNVDVITEEETSSAISKMKNNKVAEFDEITVELMKAGGQTIVSTLTTLLNTCWTSKMVPDEWSKDIIVKLPRKGNQTDCNNWRGICLLSIPGKILSTILLKRLRLAVDVPLKEEQAGFRAGRSCTEQIFTLRNIIDQCIEFQKPIVINFIDFKKAFDSVHCESLWKIAKIYGIPEQFIDIFKAIYLNSRCCIKTETGMSVFFLIKMGVR